ncbi:MAG: hypothetical protein IKK10_03955 [Clostridia bacterium]|nr:hypothetical protein [Clostridia bacterium]
MKKFAALILVLMLALSLVACSKDTVYDLGNPDRARVFYNTYNKYVENYGQGKVADGKLCGTAAVRLYDFTGDSYPEMLIVYSSEKDKAADSVVIFGFDMGLAEIYNEKITSKATASGGETLWVYTGDNNLSYIVAGEDLSASRSYLTYQKADAEGKPLYGFAEVFKTDGTDSEGTYEKFDVMCENFKDIESENKNVLNALETQKN